MRYHPEIWELKKLTSSLPEHTISGHSTVVAIENQVSTELADEAIILNLASGKYFGLDPVGARIWELIQEPQQVNSVRDTLLAEYDVDADRCERDLLALLQEMKKQELIEIKNGTGS
jgi:hypothetical protein